MIKRIFICVLGVIMAGFILSCDHSGDNGTANKTQAFIQRSYCVDSNETIINLTFYTTGNSFVTSADEIESCFIGNGSDLDFECGVLEFDIGQNPIYSEGNTKYYHGRMAIKPKELNVSIGDTVLTINKKDGGSESFNIGNIAYTDIDEEEEATSSKFADAMIVNTAEHFQNDRIGFSAVVLYLDALQDITITRFACDSEAFGFDIGSSKVYSYDEYMADVDTLIESKELDKLIPGIYERKVTDRKETAGSLNLTTGEYYIVIPIVQYEQTIPEPIRSCLDICFEVNGENHTKHVWSWQFFSENFHSQDAVTELFGK